MGGIVSLHGDKRRTRLPGSVSQEHTEIEALVHYNFPPLSHQGSIGAHGGGAIGLFHR